MERNGCLEVLVEVKKNGGLDGKTVTIRWKETAQRVDSDGVGFAMAE